MNVVKEVLYYIYINAICYINNKKDKYNKDILIDEYDINIMGDYPHINSSKS